MPCSCEPEFSWEYNASTSAGVEAPNGPKLPASYAGCYVATKQRLEELDGAKQVNGEKPAEPLTADGDADPTETREWLDSLQGVLQISGPTRARFLLTQLKDKAIRSGVEIPFTANTPYINTIPVDRQPPYPGSREIERRIKSLARWNALAMVVRANRDESGIGGHISTYASAATLLEVGFNHFFRGPNHPGGGDQVYFQGHASPGIYARAFLEGRLSA